jgi:hypothetical protein
VVVHKWRQTAVGCSERGTKRARFVIALTLGLRKGEALGLKWHDINFEQRTLTIRRTVQRLNWQHGCPPDKPCDRKYAGHCPQRHGGGASGRGGQIRSEQADDWVAAAAYQSPDAASDSPATRTRKGARPLARGGLGIRQPTRWPRASPSRPRRMEELAQDSRRARCLPLLPLLPMARLGAIDAGCSPSIATDETLL